MNLKLIKLIEKKRDINARNFATINRKINI